MLQAEATALKPKFTIVAMSILLFWLDTKMASSDKGKTHLPLLCLIQMTWFDQINFNTF